MIKVCLKVRSGNFDWTPRMFKIVQRVCNYKNLLFFDRLQVIKARTDVLEVPFKTQYLRPDVVDSATTDVLVAHHSCDGYMFFAHKEAAMMPHDRVIAVTVFNEDSLHYRTDGIEDLFPPPSNEIDL